MHGTANCLRSKCPLWFSRTINCTSWYVQVHRMQTNRFKWMKSNRCMKDIAQKWIENRDLLSCSLESRRIMFTTSEVVNSTIVCPPLPVVPFDWHRRQWKSTESQPLPLPRSNAMWTLIKSTFTMWLLLLLRRCVRCECVAISLSTFSINKIRLLVLTEYQIHKSKSSPNEYRVCARVVA